MLCLDNVTPREEARHSTRLYIVVAAGLGDKAAQGKKRDGSSISYLYSLELATKDNTAADRAGMW